MEVEKIYLDLDDVLANFRRGVRELCGMKIPSVNKETDSALDDLMWRKIREVDHFYNRLEYRLGAKEMFDKIYGQYGDKVEILTGIPKPHRGIATAAEDKMEWVRRKLSPDIRVNIVYSEEKIRYCKGRGTLLIDDREKTVREWEEKGGKGFLFVDASDIVTWLGRLGYLPYNYLSDYGPLTAPRWKRGEKATDMGLRLGLIEEEDIED